LLVEGSKRHRYLAALRHSGEGLAPEHRVFVIDSQDVS
jgi:hypothetical protein